MILVRLWMILFSLLYAPGWSFSPPYSVIEPERVLPELEIYPVTENNSGGIRLRCHASKMTTRMDDIVWEYKRCGSGLNLTACEDLSKNTPWQSAVMCRNGTKLCTRPTLSIYQPSESDSGLYRCLHKNYMERRFRVNRTFQLEVRDPKIKSLEILPEEPSVDNQTVMEGQSAVLRCRVRSVSYTHITWARYVSETSHPSTFEIGGIFYQFFNASQTHDGPNKLYTSKLHIPRVDPSDAGQYLCFALDARHNLSKIVSLDVMRQVSSYKEIPTSNEEIWWIAFALVLSAISCILVLCAFLRRREYPKKIVCPCEEALCGQNVPQRPTP